MDGSRYVAAYLIILLAQREENIVPPFSRRNPLVNLSGAFIVMASTMVPCRSVLLRKQRRRYRPSLFSVVTVTRLRLYLSSLDSSHYVAAWLIVLLAQREENIVPPFELVTYVTKNKEGVIGLLYFLS